MHKTSLLTLLLAGIFTAAPLYAANSDRDTNRTPAHSNDTSRHTDPDRGRDRDRPASDDQRRDAPGRPVETQSTSREASGSDAGRSGRSSGSTPNAGDGTAAETAGPGAGRSGSGSGNRMRVQ